MWENIPQELKFDALWCCWKLNERGKVPYDVVHGTLAKSNDKNTFYSFMTVLKHSQKYLKFSQDGKQIGGIGLGIFNGFSAIDIDHCVDVNGNISSMALEIIDYCQSYTEFSPSGTGIRIIFKTDFKNFDKIKYYTNNQKIGLEVYIEGATNKFVTMTGNVYYSSNIATVDIEYILNKYMLKNQPKQKVNEETGEIIDFEFDIDKFLLKDSKLNELWNAQASGSYGNESETDLALCNKLAFYCRKNYDLIEEYFERSPYFKSKDDKHKNKWLTRKDYRQMTIQKAIDSCVEVYNPHYVSTVKHYDLNDTGNARRFIDKYQGDIKYNIDNKMWMIWNGINWQFDVFGNIKNYAEILIEEMKMEAFKITDLEKQKVMLKNINRLYNSSGKEAMLRESQHQLGIPVNNEMFDNNDFYFNCGNGIIDLTTGKLLQHEKNYLINKYSNVKLLNKEPTIFINFLNQIFENNQELIHYIQKVFGYAMTGSTKEQKMFVFVGDGSNGKSLLLQIIGEVLGDYAATSSVELLLDKKIQTANLSEVARLKGIRCVITGESKLGDKLNEGAVKSLTGGNDKITARFLYGNEFEFYPKMKIFMATNHTPIIRGTDNGIWRRIVKIPFKRIFSEDEQDKDLIEKLRSEKSAILNWLVQGCLMWQKEGLNPPQIIADEVKEYRTEMDLVAKWIDECCEVGPGYSEKSMVLFENFIQYCKANKEYEMSNTLFGRNFSKKFEKKRIKGSFYYIGIRIRGDDEWL